ncbi:MAG: NAD(P)-dependent oxidoreductase [Pseudomonadota bacterium]
MLKFVDTPRQMPDKRDAATRTRDWQEIYPPFDPDRAQIQAARCSQCGVPYCQVHCPLHNHIPDWLMLAAHERMREAYELVSLTNALPEICGRICPQDRLCEGNCVIEQAGHGTVTIGTIEQHITHTAWDQGWITPITPPRERRQSVGIIGAGPGGLAAAVRLRAEGFQVHIYDRYDRPGGLMIYGIPNFKLDKKVVARRTDWLADSKVRFKLGVDVGRDITLADLRKRHDAVLLACGAYHAHELKAPGVGLPGVVPALHYLTASNRKGLGDQVADFDQLDARGRRVAVIGGGDTAMDCVRTATRQGASKVVCYYRRDRENMPGSQREVHHAMEENVTFTWLTGPKAIYGDDRAQGLLIQSYRLGPPDELGRRAPVASQAKPQKAAADLVIPALGFVPEDMQKTMPGLRTRSPDDPHSPVAVSWRTMATNLPGVFAAGDVVRGASLVVWAVADGQQAANAISQYLQGHDYWQPEAVNEEAFA